MRHRKTVCFAWFIGVMLATIPFIASEIEPEADEEIDYNAAARTFEEHLRKYLMTNGFDQKETIDRETFIDLFMNVTSSTNQKLEGQDNNFRLLANAIADKAGSPVKIKDIPSLLNLNEMTFLYSTLVEENNITFENEDQESPTLTNASEVLKKIKEDL